MHEPTPQLKRNQRLPANNLNALDD